MVVFLSRDTGFSFVCIPGLSRRRLGEGGSIRGWVRWYSTQERMQVTISVPFNGQNDFQWVFLKVRLSRLISGF
jgi:hypothetical protein